MKKGPSASFNNLVVIIGVIRDVSARLQAGGDKISTYVEDINRLLTLAISSNIAKATSEIVRFSKMPDESEVQFVDVVYLKAVRCGIAYPDESIEE